MKEKIFAHISTKSTKIYSGNCKLPICYQCTHRIDTVASYIGNDLIIYVGHSYSRFRRTHANIYDDPANVLSDLQIYPIEGISLFNKCEISAKSFPLFSRSSDFVQDMSYSSL